MILGLGIDLVNVASLAGQLDEPGTAFGSDAFTAQELEYCRSAGSGEPARHLSARYAAKEAAIKALDLACAAIGAAAIPVLLREVEVVRDSRGRTALRFHGGAATLASRLGVDRAFLSLTHDGAYAMAVVVLEHIG